MPLSKSALAAEECVLTVRTDWDPELVREALWPGVDLADANTQLNMMIAKQRWRRTNIGLLTGSVSWRAGDIQVTTVTSSGAGIGHCSPWQEWEQPPAEARVGSPGWPSLTARAAEGDVVGPRPPPDLLNACPDPRQHLLSRPLPLLPAPPRPPPLPL